MKIMQFPTPEIPVTNRPPLSSDDYFIWRIKGKIARTVQLMFSTVRLYFVPSRTGSYQLSLKHNEKTLKITNRAYKNSVLNFVSQLCTIISILILIGPAGLCLGVRVVYYRSSLYVLGLVCCVLCIIFFWLSLVWMSVPVKSFAWKLSSGTFIFAHSFNHWHRSFSGGVRDTLCFKNCV